MQNKDHSNFLASIREYVGKHPEVAGRISDYVTEGLVNSRKEVLERAADTEIALAVAIEKRYNKRDELILSKLNKWKDKSAINWTDTIEMLKKRTAK